MRGSRNSASATAFELIGHGLMRPHVSVIIPTLNEEQNIAWVLDRLPTDVDEVVIVDGRSTDSTIEAALAVRPDARVILEPRPGKGAALRAGFHAARGDYVVMLDADGSMNPDEITRFVDALRDGAEFVKGSRFMPDGGTSDMTLIRKAGNAGLRGLVNVLYGCRFTDLCYGFCGFRRAALAELGLRSDGFEIETEIVVRAVKAQLRITEVPSFESPRRHGDSNLNAWRDGRRVLRTLLHERVGDVVVAAPHVGTEGSAQAAWSALPNDALAAGAAGDEARA
ncbi:MAG: glycosyltransferase family 2 protein [Solirubrobacterales bacterium]|nr:glycosyltransferase family 2 protein [Solirubrobacterales bacterium]